MENGSIDILVGTQMIAKGLDFPNLNLIGLILADIGFHIPDFRANERSFQLLVQMSGRAGRHSQTPGQVVLQTYCPNHASIQFAKNNDYEGFATNELELRKNLGYPPFQRLCLLRVQGPRLENVTNTVKLLAERCQQLQKLRKQYASLKLLGPAQSSIAKLRNKYRYILLIKSPSSHLAQLFCKEVLNDSSWVLPQTKVHIDVDPLNML